MKILMNKVEAQYSEAYSADGIRDSILATHCVVNLCFDNSQPLEFFSSLTADEQKTFLHLSNQIRNRILNEIKTAIGD